MNKLLAQAPLGTIDGTGTSAFAPTSPADSPQMLETLFSTIFGFLTIVGGLAFLIYFVIGALNWIMAGGDSKKVDTAKSYMINGAIGMIIIVAAYSIIWIVGNVLGFNILRPAESINNIVNPAQEQPNRLEERWGGPQE